MINFFISISFLFFLGGCSTSTPPNQWQYRSTTAFNSYEKNFLRENLLVAREDLKRAIKHAKMSADLEQLGAIYLGECALNIATSTKSFECADYTKIAPLLHSKRLSSYYDFLQKKPSDIEALPREYQNIAKLFVNQSFQEYKKVLFDIEKPTSLFVSASLLQKKLDSEDMQKIIDKASLYGYKRVVLFWLDRLRASTKDSTIKEKISKKIEILLYP